MRYDKVGEGSCFHSHPWNSVGMRWSREEVSFSKRLHKLHASLTVIRLVCVCSDKVPEQVDQETDLCVWKLLGAKQKSMCL